MKKNLLLLLFLGAGLIASAQNNIRRVKDKSSIEYSIYLFSGSLAERSFLIGNVNPGDEISVYSRFGLEVPDVTVTREQNASIVSMPANASSGRYFVEVTARKN